MFTSRIIGGGVQVSLSDEQNVINFRGPETPYNEPIYINAKTGKTNLNLSGSVLQELIILQLKTDVVKPYTGTGIVFSNGTNSYEVF